MRPSLKAIAAAAFAGYMLTGCSTLPDAQPPEPTVPEREPIVVGTGDMANKISSIIPQLNQTVFADPVEGVTQQEFDMVTEWYGTLANTMYLTSIFHVKKPDAEELFNKYDYQYVLSSLDPAKDYTEAEIYDVMADTANEILKGLDTHSHYFQPVSNERMQRSLKGEMKGIGIQFEIGEQGIQVKGLIKNGPAKEAGIQKGDIITHDGEKDFTDLENSADFLQHVSENDNFSFTVIRDGEILETPISFSKEVIDLEIVTATVFNDSIAHFYINQFTVDVHKRLRDKFNEVNEQFGDDLKGVILDVRGNPGGALNAVLAMASNFTEGERLLYTKEAANTRFNNGYLFTNYVRPQSMPLLTDLPLAVLVDERSASASEILAGILQDHGRATIIGDSSTHGKANSQVIYEDKLPDGRVGGIKVTKGYIYLPESGSYQATGISPDILVSMNPEKKAAMDAFNGPIFERDHENHLPNPDSEPTVRAPYFTCDIKDGLEFGLVDSFSMSTEEIKEADEVKSRSLLCAIEHLTGENEYTDLKPVTVPGPAPVPKAKPMS